MSSQSRVSTTRVINNTPTPREMIAASARARVMGYALKSHVSADKLATIVKSVN